MIRPIFSKIIATCLLFMMMVLVACNDNSTSTEPPEKPVVPELSEVQPDISYFENNYPAGNQKFKTIMETYDNFNSAAGSVIGGAFTLGFGQAMASYVEMAKTNEADFEDGAWVWEYSYERGDESFSIRLTAEVNETAGEAKWTLYVSGTNGDEQIENFKFMEGTSSLDGQTGNWKIYNLEDNGSSTAFLSFEWTISSNDEKSFRFTLNEYEGAESFEVTFEQTGAEHTMTMYASDGSTDITVYWNTDTQAGYIIDSGEKSCWNSNFEDVECTE